MKQSVTETWYGEFSIGNAHCAEMAKFERGATSSAEILVLHYSEFFKLANSFAVQFVWMK